MVPKDTGGFPYTQIGDYIVITNSRRPPLKFAILNGHFSNSIKSVEPCYVPHSFVYLF